MVGAIWDERFARDDYVYGTTPNDFLAEQAHRLPKGAFVASLGEGEGRNAVFLAEHGHRVLAIDASRVGLEKASKLAAERGVTIETCHTDLAHLDLDALTRERALDGVVSVFCHVPSALRREVHRKVLAALGKGGLFIVEAYRPEQLAYHTGGPKDRDMLVRLAELEIDFTGAERVVGRELEREVIEGMLHTGRAAVVQAVFRKR
jgi:hypothetical protein